MDTAPSRTRVVVLGSGQAALTAAFQLTHPDNPRRADYEVTVYQMGWRLGGKGAAGRNLEAPFGYRIEEHGLHNWFGFYDNSFRQIRDCYAELNRVPDAPLATWQQAFVPANEAVFVETIGDRHVQWVIRNPPNAETPGSGGLLLPIWEYALMAIEAMLGLWRELAPRAGIGAEGRVVAAIDAEITSVVAHLGVDVTVAEDDLAEKLLGAALKVARVVGKAACGVVSAILRRFVSWLWSEVEPVVWTNDDARHLFILANFGFGCLAGCIDGDVFTKGFDALNEEDFRPWLARYVIDDGGVTMKSAIVRAVYDSSFAYRKGDMTIPPGSDHPPGEAYEAGTALRGMVRASFTYKGAFGWRFAAGTADTCYAPMFLVLKARGVRFRFFHRVEAVEAGEGAGAPIARVRIARQVDLADGRAEYDPLFDVKGLPCWPNRPFWDQIAGGEAIAASGVNLEQPPADFPDAEHIVLEHGRDFDAVVLGISIAALPPLCPTILAKSAKWRAMVDHVETVRTAALQTWSKPTAWQLGFQQLGQPIASWEYDDTSLLNVWGDLSALLPFEGWPVEHWPQNVAYFTSAMPDDVGDAPSPESYVRARAIAMLERGIGIVWKNASSPAGGFRWELLVDARPGAPVGSDRIDAQYYRANVAATERYVLSVPGSSKYRLPANDPDEIPNLYLAGDWTWCNLNSGCMEAATMSGMLCASALSGFPAHAEIVGVDFG